MRTTVTLRAWTAARIVACRSVHDSPEPSLCPSTGDEKDGEAVHDREAEDRPSKREPSTSRKAITATNGIASHAWAYQGITRTLERELGERSRMAADALTPM